MVKVTYREQFPLLIDDLNLSGSGIEIGVGLAKFSKILLESNLSTIYLLDAWKEFSELDYKDSSNRPQKEQDDKYDYVVKEMSKYGDRVKIIRKDCREAVLEFNDNFFDYIYIDANHEYEYVKNDILSWYPKLKNGGIFSGHDYMDGTNRMGTYGVKSAVDEFCKNIGQTPIITRGTRRCPPSWYFVKK